MVPERCILDGFKYSIIITSDKNSTRKDLQQTNNENLHHVKSIGKKYSSFQVNPRIYEIKY